MANAVQEGSKVTLHYTGTFDDGVKFDSSKGREPLEFTVGEHKVIPGFEEGVKGMKKGEKKTIKVAPADGYGERRDEMVQKIPKDKIPENMTLKKGMVLTFKGPKDKTFMATISDFDDKDITLDLNHPLAGKNLNFEVEIIGIT